MYKYGHRTRGHPKLQRLLAFVFTLVMLVTMVPADLAKADAIEHTHIWADKYDSNNHWKYCTVCGAVKDKEVHTFTDHWAFGYESCRTGNYSERICNCGYSYIYHKPHSTTHISSSTYYERVHATICSSCGDWLKSEACKNANGAINCKNPGKCLTCGGTWPAGRHFINDGTCRACGKIFYKLSEPQISYSDDYTHVYIKYIFYPTDSSVVPIDTQTNYSPYTNGGRSHHGSVVKNLDGTYTINLDVTILSPNEKALVGWFYDNVAVNGVTCVVYTSAITVWKDHQAPVQNEVIQKDQASANGWATIKQLTLSGTENLSDIVYLTVSDKATGEKYVTDAAVSVVDGKYSYTCTPSVEGDTNGRTYVVTAKDRIGNTSTKEFIISKTDGSAPQLKNGTSLTYTDWSTSKNISLSFFDFGAGGVEASLDNQTDYKALTKSGEYYIWNHSFGNQVGTTEHTIYVKDALGNATSYKLTEGNTDSTAYKITYNLNGGSMSGQKTSYTVADSFTLQQPTKTGYTFTGWIGSNGTTPQKTVTVNKGTRGNLSYIANWSANNYYVTFNGNGGSLNVMDGSIAKNNNGTATAKVQYDLNYYYLLGILATKPGFTFKGFYDAPSGGIQVFRVDGTTRCLSVTSKYYNENNIWKYAGNVTLYAQWEPITWTTKYDANGGTGTMADTIHRFNCGDKIRHNQFTRPGWTMTGWTVSRVRNGITEWHYGTSDGHWINGHSWYELGQNPPGTSLWVEHKLDTVDNSSTYIDGDVHTMHAQWSYNPVSVKVPQILIGDHTGKSQFRVKCEDFKAGNIKITVPNNFLYKQAGKADVTATITSKSGNNTITPTNKVCIYDITTKNGLSAGCWQGSFNIGLTLTKE